MKPFRPLLVMCFVGMTAFASATARAQATLYGVGDLPGGVVFSDVRDATRAGGVLYAVGGTSSKPGTNVQDTAYLWTSTGGMTALPDLVPGLTDTNGIIASAITPDARYIASRARFNPNNSFNRHAVRVTTAGLVNIDLGSLPSAPPNSSATSISADGSVLYGFSGNGLGRTQAVRWTVNGPTITPIPFALPGDDASVPAGRGTSADGRVMVGTSMNSSVLIPPANYGVGNHAFRYVDGTGMTAIPYLAGGHWNTAMAVSPDGNLVLVGGDSAAAVNGELYLYNAATGATTALGTPAAGGEISNASLFGGMNADGSLVVAAFGDEQGSAHASFLRNSHGWHDLKDVMTDAGIDLAGWTITDINGMSADGTLVWGAGVHNGNNEGVIVEFPAGYLAGYVGAPPPPSLVGAWTTGDATQEGAGVITFLNGGYYVEAEEATANDGPNAFDGIERGTYTWDPVTKAFRITAVLLDTNGSDGGPSNALGLTGTATVVGDYLTVSFPADANHPDGRASTLVRVHGTSPLVGSWIVGNPAVPDDTTVVTFLPDGVYFLAQDGDSSPVTGDPNGQDGMERGTYTWDPATGAFTATTITDTNGEWGLSNPRGTVTIVVSGDVLTFTDSVDGSMQADRVRFIPGIPAIPVTNTHDSGAGSLRDAIAQANALVGAKEIVLNVTGTIALTSGPLAITTGPVTITGPGAGKLVIDGSGNSRIFQINDPSPQSCPALTGPNDFLVTISGLTLRNATNNSANTSGGAIVTRKSLLLDSVVVRDNAAQGSGGGVAFFTQYPGQSLTITNSQFIANVATPTLAGATGNTNGGALLVNENCTVPPARTGPATVSIARSVFSGNRAMPTTSNGAGGAIAVYALADVTITDTRIVDNHVVIPAPRPSGPGYNGGGLQVWAKSLTIERSEVAENSADTGGGIDLFNNYRDLQTPATALVFRLVNSTVSNNDATSPGAIRLYGNVAGSIYNSTIAGNTGRTQFISGVGMQTGATFPASASNAVVPTLKVVSSIFSNQTVGSTADIGISLTSVPSPYVVDATNSLVQNPGLGVQIKGSGNFIGVVPYLGPLAFNGGPTRTQAPLPTSLAIDRGANPLGLATDQRGAGYPRVQKAAADMGAYEGAGAFLPGIGFLPPVKYPAGHPSLRVAVDLSGDGATDLASVNTTGSTADVLTNNGDGTFTTRTYAVGSQPATVVACDVNGDNKRDLVTVDTGSNTLSILVNQGDGTFAPAKTLATGSKPIALTCQANLSSPLRHNLNVVNGGDNTLMQFQDDGAGNFTLKATVPIGADTRAIATSDLDFDSVWDSVTASFGSDSVSVLKQGANFAYARTDYPVQAGPVSLSLVDVSGDGFLDIVTENATANSISVLINNGGTTFKPAVSYPVGANPRAHSTGDFNRDGSTDIAVRNSGSNDIAVLLNNGDGTFAPAVFYPVGGSPASISATDFDADGALDLVVVVPSLNGVAVLYGNGDGSFRPAIVIPVGTNPSATVQVADLNGDGRPDIAVPLLGEDKISVLLNTTEYRLGPAARANYQGAWVKAPNGTEAGWAVFFAHQGDTIVATWFTYGQDGKPLWLTATLARTATNAYTGTLFAATGPAYDATPFDPARVASTAVGSLTVTFFGSDNAYFAYTVNGVAQAKTITREVFASPVPVCSWGAEPDLTIATNYQDQWGTTGEAGWAVAITHQGDTLVATWSTFGADGKPLWFLIVARTTGPNTYAGPVTTYTGPAFGAVPWDPAQVTETVVGSASFTFSDGSHGVFTPTVNGKLLTKNITRQVFAPPGTVCF